MIRVGIEDFGKTSLERADLLLAGIPGGLDKAVKSAMSRTAQYVRTQSSKRVREVYDISATNLRTEENIKVTYRYTAGSGVEASILYRGRKIPLYRYNGTSPKNPTQSTDIAYVNLANRIAGTTDFEDNWVKVHPAVPAAGHLLKATSPAHFSNAFVARFKNGHTGIFERTGGMTSEHRDELREIMGLSIPQMIGNDNVLESIAKDASDKFDERLAHEVEAVLNGWR